MGIMSAPLPLWLKPKFAPRVHAHPTPTQFRPPDWRADQPAQAQRLDPDSRRARKPRSCRDHRSANLVAIALAQGRPDIPDPSMDLPATE